jgi:hypothetical protein
MVLQKTEGRFWGKPNIAYWLSMLCPLGKYLEQRPPFSCELAEKGKGF